MTKGYHTRWDVPEAHRASPAYIEAGAAIALGQAVYDRRMALDLSPSEVAQLAGLSEADIEQIEGGAVAPKLALLHALARALDAKLDLSIDADDTFVRFTAHAA
ncbi:helix-turn-helix domain-containing protein [Streptomyces sp. NPDC006326]|uniref:helix-turn-helix domain-containing protein n=1 Tax=Streptomyces sp. NPDC006326 TaxID=3156752 RepID=UPI0033A794A1